MTSGLAKDAWDHIPYLQDQGIQNVVGAVQHGLSMVSFQTTMPGGGVIALPVTMADGNYQVHIHNHTGTVQGTVGNADRLINQITVAGPTAADVLDITLVGRVAGQLA